VWCVVCGVGVWCVGVVWVCGVGVWCVVWVCGVWCVGCVGVWCVVCWVCGCVVWVGCGYVVCWVCVWVVCGCGVWCVGVWCVGVWCDGGCFVVVVVLFRIHTFCECYGFWSCYGFHFSALCCLLLLPRSCQNPPQKIGLIYLNYKKEKMKLYGWLKTAIPPPYLVTGSKLEVESKVELAAS
jgi:hypothetical protein